MPLRQDSVGSRMHSMVIATNFKMDFIDLGALADNFVLPEDVPPVIFAQPSAARDLLLPNVNVSKGRALFFHNNSGGAFTLTLKTHADAATGISFAQNAFGLVFCDGAAWYQLA